jgi:hypothetical protein
MKDNHMHIGIIGKEGTGPLAGVSVRGAFSDLMANHDIAGPAEMVQHAIKAKVVKTIVKRVSWSSFCHTCVLRRDQSNCKNCDRK